jgi:hypothetical protein
VKGVQRWRWALLAALLGAGLLIALLAVSSVTTCPSCFGAGNRCPCSTDYRIVPRLLIVAVAVLAAAGLWYATRRRTPS